MFVRSTGSPKGKQLCLCLNPARCMKYHWPTHTFTSCVRESNSQHVNSQAFVPKESLKTQEPKIKPYLLFSPGGIWTQVKQMFCKCSATKLYIISNNLFTVFSFFVCNHMASRFPTFIIAVDLRNNLRQKEFFWEDLSHFVRCDTSWWGRHGDSDRKVMVVGMWGSCPCSLVTSRVRK